MPFQHQSMGFISILSQKLTLITLPMSNNSYVAILNPDNAVQTVTQAGTATTLTSNDFAQGISVGADGIIWVVSSQGDPITGGNLIKYSEDQGKSWNLPGGTNVPAVKIAGAPSKAAWYLDENYAVWSVATGGNPTRITADNTALDIAIDAVGRVWIITFDVNPTLGGNIVKHTTLTEKNFQELPNKPVAAKIAAWQDGSAWVVTPKGEVGFIELDGTTGLLSPAGQMIAMQIGISPNSGTSWILGIDVVPTGGNKIQYWDEKGTQSSDWKIVPNTAAINVAGGG